MLRLLPWVILMLLPVAVVMAQVEPIPGDLDRDGDVDFQDFLQFAQNFGKTGPPPMPTPAVRDTVEIKVTVRDTVEVEAELTLRELRGLTLLGFWSFYWSSPDTTIGDHFCLGEIHIPEDEQEEIVVGGVSNQAILVGASYNLSLEMYILLYRYSPERLGLAYVFTLDEEGRASGKLYLEGVESFVEVADFEPGTGKTPEGTGFKDFITPSSKLALRAPLPTGPPAPPEVTAAVEDLKAALQAQGIF